MLSGPLSQLGNSVTTVQVSGFFGGCKSWTWEWVSESRGLLFEEELACTGRSFGFVNLRFFFWIHPSIHPRTETDPGCRMHLLVHVGVLGLQVGCISLHHGLFCQASRFYTQLLRDNGA